jgi:hypothetical protein
VTEATGVSERTVKRILKKKRTRGTRHFIWNAWQKHNVPRRITEIENFDKYVVRRTILSFCAEKGTVPAIAKLLGNSKRVLILKEAVKAS